MQWFFRQVTADARENPEKFQKMATWHMLFRPKIGHLAEGTALPYR
jgi:hypothetical protein